MPVGLAEEQEVGDSRVVSEHVQCGMPLGCRRRGWIGVGGLGFKGGVRAGEMGLGANSLDVKSNDWLR